MPDEKRPLVSICIPTFKEADYIQNALVSLSKQTLWKDSEVVIADYDPDDSDDTIWAVQDLAEGDHTFDNVKIVKVKQKGIGIARRMAVQAARAPFILTFDADCEFSRLDAMEKLLEPLVLGEAMLCHCPNYLNAKEKPHPLPDMLYALRNQFIGPGGIPCEPGLTFSRAAYDSIGGWDDVQMAEGPLLAIKFITQIGTNSMRYVEDVFVIVSSRRTGGGAFLDLDYNKGYRKDKVLDVR